MILNDLFESAALVVRPMRTLAEMAPSPEMRGQRFYHGTPTTAAAASIWKTGIRPGHEVQGRGFTAPVAGRTYLTPDIRYAAIYAIGGDMLGSKLSDDWLAKSRYGYIFVVAGTDLADVQPDEDSIGAFVGDHAQYPKRDYGDGRLLSDRSKPPEFHCDPADPDRDAKARVWYLLRSLLTPRQFQKACDGEIAYQAAGGKAVMKKLPDSVKANLLRWGAHVATEGVMKPIECWRLDKKKCQLLNKDGSNFFEIAQKMQRVRA